MKSYKPQKLSSNERKHRQRERLLRYQRGKCVFCSRQIEIVIPDKGKSPPDHAAVFDRDQGQIVLACYACNFKRSREEHLTIPLEERRIMAKRQPGTIIHTVANLKDYLKQFRQGQTAFRHDKYWYAKQLPMSLRDFNKRILPPGSELLVGKHTYPEGATAVRINNYQWICAVLPYEYHILPIEHIVGTVWENLNTDDCEFLNDTVDQVE